MLEVILESINKNKDDIAIGKFKNRAAITYEMLFNTLLEHGKDTRNILKLGENTITRVLSKHFNKSNNQEKWVTFILRKFNSRRCSTCKNILPLSEYSESCGTYMNISSICKKCDHIRNKQYRNNNPEKCKSAANKHYRDNKSYYLAKNVKRRAAKLNATPSWANLEKIKQIYKLRPDGYHVDHVIPLKGKIVCGLHVENNLQYLLAKDNLSKANKIRLTDA